MATVAGPEEATDRRLSPPELKVAISKLRRRLDELRALDLSTLTDANEKAILGSFLAKIDQTLIDIYGANSQSYLRYRVRRLDATSLAQAIAGGRRSWPTVSQRLSGIRQGIREAAAKLKTAIEMAEEALVDAADDADAKAIRAYADLSLQPDIARAASKLFQDCHYANAVEAAVKALQNLVRLRSGLELDGTALMQQAFSPNKPIVRFNDLVDQSDRDEQTGYMMMFTGAVSALRNPRAHRLVNDEPERALEFIAFVSLLAKLLDGASEG